MNVLVIGASGYLGQEVLHQCQEAGHKVTGTYAHNQRPGLQKFEFGESNPDELLGLDNFDAAVWTTYGYRPGLGDFLLRALVDEPSIRLIYVSSDAVTSEAALALDGPLGEYARMKQAEEAIVADRALTLRLGPLYGKTSSGTLDKRTQNLIERCKQNEQQDYWDNAYKSFTAVTEVAKYIAAELASDSHGTYFLGPNTRESYFQFFTRRAGELGLDTSLIRPTQLDAQEAKQKGIGFDTSFHTHSKVIEL